MLATLLVLSVLHAAPLDAPRLDVSTNRSVSLLASTAAAAHAYGLLSHEHEPGVPAPANSLPFLRAFGGFFLGFGAQFVVGTLLLVTEIVTLFGASIIAAAFTKGAAAGPILDAGAGVVLGLNGAILPLVSAFPIWLLAAGDVGFSHSFLWTWLSGVATYATFWALQAPLNPELGTFRFLLWPTHLASWFFISLVQSAVVYLTREESSFAARAPSPALLNVRGGRVSLGAPVPGIMADISRPGRLVPMLSLAQGRF